MTRSRKDTIVILIKDGDTDFTTAWSSSDDGGPGQFAGPRRTAARAAAEAHVDVSVFFDEFWTADDVTADGALAAIVHAAGDRTWYLDLGPRELVAARATPTSRATAQPTARSGRSEPVAPIRVTPRISHRPPPTMMRPRSPRHSAPSDCPHV